MNCGATFCKWHYSVAETDLHTRIHPASRKHSASRLRISLMLFPEITAVYSETHTNLQMQ